MNIMYNTGCFKPPPNPQKMTETENFPLYRLQKKYFPSEVDDSDSKLFSFIQNIRNLIF